MAVSGRRLSNCVFGPKKEGATPVWLERITLTNLTSDRILLVGKEVALWATVHKPRGMGVENNQRTVH